MQRARPFAGLVGQAKCVGRESVDGDNNDIRGRRPGPAQAEQPAQPDVLFERGHGWHHAGDKTNQCDQQTKEQCLDPN